MVGQQSRPLIEERDADTQGPPDRPRAEDRQERGRMKVVFPPPLGPHEREPARPRYPQGEVAQHRWGAARPGKADVVIEGQ